MTTSTRIQKRETAISEDKNAVLRNIFKWNIYTMKRFFHKVSSETMITRIFITNNVKAKIN